ncbi:MAG: hypothetical protein QG652_895, partial [Pseudomonadota bacterium]|nr:hypothetical protein [Pseudomonadota bacterium]
MKGIYGLAWLVISSLNISPKMMGNKSVRLTKAPGAILNSEAGPQGEGQGACSNANLQKQAFP